MPSRLGRVRDVLTAAKAVKKQTGKGVVVQLLEMNRLLWGYGRLLPADYFAYRVFDDACYPGSSKRDIVSWTFGVLARLNDPRWRGVADDKLVTYAVLSSFGLPHPRVLAVFHARGRLFGATPVLVDRSQIEAYLRCLKVPAFGKPIAGTLGRGASSIDRYDPNNDALMLAGGERLSVPEYVGEYVLPARGGYLVQERVAPHPAILPITGPAVSTLRMVVLNGRTSARLFRVMWKLAIGGQITDNFRRGTAGNLKAWVDRRQGRVETAFLGRGENVQARYGPDSLGRFVNRHPDSGHQLVGVDLPQWDEAVSLVLRAARHFPGLRYQSWDVALSDRGPTILELNGRGLPQQLPGFPGMNDDELRSFIREERQAAMAEHAYFLLPYRSLNIFRHPGVKRGSRTASSRRGDDHWQPHS